MIARICATLNVSPNFLLGFPSPQMDQSEQALLLESVMGQLEAFDPAKPQLVRDLIGRIGEFGYPVAPEK
jgi:hypothetical protein